MEAKTKLLLELAKKVEDSAARLRKNYQGVTLHARNAGEIGSYGVMNQSEVLANELAETLETIAKAIRIIAES